jgi:hypothetical protein
VLSSSRACSQSGFRCFTKAVPCPSGACMCHPFCVGML